MPEAYTSVARKFEPGEKLNFHAFSNAKHPDQVGIYIRQTSTEGHIFSIALTMEHVDQLVEFLHRIQTQVAPFDIS